MGRAPSVLTVRAAAFLALLGSLIAYYLVREDLPNLSTNGDVLLIALVLLPAVFGLVLLALPLWRAQGLLLTGLVVAVLALMLDRAEFHLAANFTKLAAMTLLAFAFLQLFESVGWVVLVAAIIPWVDAFSVWRGPTRHIVREQRELFTTLSFAFPVPGERGSANLGLPDILFFALFLGAAARFGLRVPLTWLGLTASIGVTMLAAVLFDVAGLPALPLISLGFLLPNADLLWRQLRPASRASRRPSESRSARQRAEEG